MWFIGPQGESGWGETVWGSETHSVEGRLEVKHSGTQHHTSHRLHKKKLPV